jgi:hypothetical protein
MKRLRYTVSVLLLVLSVAAVGPAHASDESDIKAVIEKWVMDFNKGDKKSFLGACASHTAVIDGFPPYAWDTCSGWIHDYEANNKLIQATPGTLAIAKPIYSEVNGDRAYFVYPVTFTDKQKGKTVTYKGTWAMTLLRTQRSWVFTGSGSNWG